ncbi:ABC transporter substrate-binding protein [Acaryochloris thomasi]|nr:iron-siderophore ABC transporter substrate-binding protein [Acaryochloris thomasi]
MTALIIACNHASNPAVTSPTDCRTIQHAMGESCVPTTPQRLVALSSPTMADAIALGVRPIGTVLQDFDFQKAPPYLEGRLQGIEIVGKEEQPDLEKILSLKPDLIIGLQYDSEPVYDKLSQISPTVLDDWKGYPSWKEHFDFVAQALGKTEAAQQIWSQYDQRIQELRTALGPAYSDLEISFVRVCCGNWATDVKNSFSGMILEDVGLSRPPAQDIEVENGLVFLSEEALTQFDGDIIFLVVDADQDSADALEQLKQKPLWHKLKAVQQGKVYPVNLATWRGGNPLAADAVIDDLFKYLVKVPDSQGSKSDHKNTMAENAPTR